MEKKVSEPSKTLSSSKKQTKLETADQMFKDAFLIKKTRFSHLYPHLSKEDLHLMTVAYFKKLNTEKSQ